MESAITLPSTGGGVEIYRGSDLFTMNAPLKVVTVTRTHHLDDGEFGILDIDGGPPAFVTVELPWRNNQQMLSCIPVGEYLTFRKHSDHFMTDVFEVANVPNRTFIEIHMANLAKELLGCIGIGKELGLIGGRDAVLYSRAAFFDFMGRFKDVDQFKLVIQNA